MHKCDPRSVTKAGLEESDLLSPEYYPSCPQVSQDLYKNVNGRKYKIQNTKYKIQNTKYKIQNTGCPRKSLQ